MHSPLAMQDLAHFSDSARALAEAENVEHAGDDGFRIGVAQPGRPRDRAGLEAFAAFGAGVEHVVDARCEGFLESGVLHAI